MKAASDQWTSHIIAGHTCDVYRPAGRSEHKYSVIYLHGVHLEALRGKKPFLNLFEKFGLTVFAPQCGPTWWSDRPHPAFDERMSPETYLLEHILPFVAETNGAAPSRVALLGTSMGGQGALRFSYKYPHTFPVVAAISPAIDYHLRIDEGDEILMEMYGDRESARQETALLHIHPLNWPRHQFFCCDPKGDRWYESADRLRMKLSSLGVMHQCDLETSGGGHGFKYYNRMAEKAITFLHNGLERERLRIR
jgi:S-formylglutathione hydrolase FrmB